MLDQKLEIMRDWSAERCWGWGGFPSPAQANETAPVDIVFKGRWTMRMEHRPISSFSRTQHRLNSVSSSLSVPALPSQATLLIPPPQEGRSGVTGTWRSLDQAHFHLQDWTPAWSEAGQEPRVGGV